MAKKFEKKSKNKIKTIEPEKKGNSDTIDKKIEGKKANGKKKSKLSKNIQEKIKKPETDTKKNKNNKKPVYKKSSTQYKEKHKKRAIKSQAKNDKQPKSNKTTSKNIKKNKNSQKINKRKEKIQNKKSTEAIPPKKKTDRINKKHNRKEEIKTKTRKKQNTISLKENNANKIQTRTRPKKTLNKGDYIEKIQEFIWTKVYTANICHNMLINPKKYGEFGLKSIKKEKSKKNTNDKSLNFHTTNKVKLNKDIKNPNPNQINENLNKKTTKKVTFANLTASNINKLIPKWSNKINGLKIHILSLHTDTYIYLLRKHDLILTECFLGQRGGFFSCYFYETYHVLTKDSYLIFFPNPYIKGKMAHINCVNDRGCSCKDTKVKSSDKDMKLEIQNYRKNKKNDCPGCEHEIKNDDLLKNINKRKVQPKNAIKCIDIHCSRIGCGNQKFCKNTCHCKIINCQRKDNCPIVDCKCCGIMLKIEREKSLYKHTKCEKATLRSNNDLDKDNSDPLVIDYTNAENSKDELNSSIPNQKRLKDILHRSDEVSPVYNSGSDKMKIMKLDKTVSVEKVDNGGGQFPFITKLKQGNYIHEIGFQSENLLDFWVERFNYLLGDG